MTKYYEVIIGFKVGKWDGLPTAESIVNDLCEANEDIEFFAKGYQGPFDSNGPAHIYCHVGSEPKAQVCCRSFDLCEETGLCSHYDENTIQCDDPEIRKLHEMDPEREET